MGVRESLNKRPRIAGGVAIVLLAIAVGAFALSLRGPANATKAYFSSDDGKTFFVDDTTKMVPFDHNGASAYRAVVYKCGNGDPFVSYLIRYSDAAKTKIAQLASDPGAVGEITQVKASGTEVKKPGESQWVAVGSQKGEQISQHPSCPDGGRATGISP